MTRLRLPAGLRTLLRAVGLIAAILAAVASSAGAAGFASTPRPVTAPASIAAGARYVLIGWNDLGMHCSNKRFADLAVLPPYNTIWAQVIRQGSSTQAPSLVGPEVTLAYVVESNTYSVGKTDFWSYEDRLFGVQLPDNIGLTGKGLSGGLEWNTDHFEAIGVPLTPFDDADLVHEQPFQLARLEARGAGGALLATTEIVMPVSNEMMCSDCHQPRAGETVEMAILRKHDEENGTALLAHRPVLCASCHASNALGLPGNPGLPSLSLAIHQRHGEETNNCYKCHPGPNTQCLRDVMSEQHALTCQNCHGGVAEVAASIEAGRQPWLQEPRCETCHGAAYAEAPNTLYRNSRNGHGGLSCSACHGSPHAILPSREERDNRQSMLLQGFTGTLKRCDVCHGYVPWAPGPHGLYPTGVDDPVADAMLRPSLAVAPNPAATSTEIRYRVLDRGPLQLAIYDVAGRLVRTLTTNPQTPGSHTLVWDGTDAGARRVASGLYFCRLQTGGRSVTTRVVLTIQP